MSNKITKEQDYYSLGTYADYIYITRKISDDYRQKYCFVCGHYPRILVPIPLTAMDDGADASVRIVFHFGIYFLWNELIDIFQPYIEHEAILAKIKLENGSYIETGKIIWPKEKVFYTRGNKGSINFKCEECGQRMYLAYGRQYVLSKDIDNSPFKISSGGFVFNNAIYEQIISHPNWKKIKKKIYLGKIKIHDTPRDGYPLNLDETPPENEKQKFGLG
jgi:hypothetical protein